jgi:hypothetical protein
MVVHGSTTENTLNSRIRRAINCVYCDPKSRITIVDETDERVADETEERVADEAGASVADVSGVSTYPV